MAAIALLGSGEFLPWARTVDTWCAERATAPSDRALVVPTASALEGETVFERWGRMGTDHYRALGLVPQVLPLRERADAERPAIVDAVADARIVFFSGGNPGYLAETLAGTPFWEAVLDAVARGTALGGCSAGAVSLGTLAPFVADQTVRRWVPGLRLLEHAYVAPHFDALDSFRPGLQKLILSMRPAGSSAVGIDENTAICGDGEIWTVHGSGALWVSADGSGDLGLDLARHDAGTTVSLPLGLRLG